MRELDPVREAVSELEGVPLPVCVLMLVFDEELVGLFVGLDVDVRLLVIDEVLVGLFVRLDVDVRLLVPV